MELKSKRKKSEYVLGKVEKNKRGQRAEGKANRPNDSKMGKRKATATKMNMYTYDMIEIHPRPTYNLFDNYTPTATVCMNLHGIETFHSDMALHSNLLQIK